MSVASTNLQSLLANPLSALSGSSTTSSAVGGGSNVFAQLIAALTGQSLSSTGAAANGTAATGSTSASTAGSVGTSASNAQISQDLDAFMQSLRQALALTQSGDPTAGSSGSSGSSAQAVTHHSGHHGHHGMHSGFGTRSQELDSSGSAATGTSSSSSGSASGALTSLNSAFNQLLGDLGATTNTGSAVQLLNATA